MLCVMPAFPLTRAAVALCVWFACTLPAWCPRVFALDASLDISQYAHTAWRNSDGFAKGAPQVFAQTPDGYLWVGTDLGLLRFDGVRTTPWQPPAGMSLPDNRIRALLGARDGTLLIGTPRGLVSWDGVKLMQYPGFNGTAINALAEDREGTLWASARFWSRPVGLFCAIRGGRTTCTGQDGSLGCFVGSLYQDSRGVLWVAAGDVLWRWKPGPPVAYPLQERVEALQALSETATGAIVVITPHGIKQLIDGKVQTSSAAPTTPLVGASALLGDRDGGLWIGTLDAGLRHVHNGRVDDFGQADGLSGNSVRGLFEDREGSVWVATDDGIDRFRPLAVATYSAKQGVSGRLLSVLADRDARIWVSGTTGLYRLDKDFMSVDPERRGREPAGAGPAIVQRPTGDAGVVAGPSQSAAASLFQDSHGRIWIGALSGLGYLDEQGRFVALSDVPGGYIDSFAEDRAGNLWIVHRDAGLLQVSRDRVVQRFPWTSISQSGPAWRLATDSVHGGLWLGFFSEGVVHFVDGQVRASYSVRDGLGKGSVRHLSVGTDGSLWAATDGGLSRIEDGRIATLDSSSGLPCDTVNSMIHDDDGAYWIHTACGLVRIAGSDLDAWAAAVDHGNTPQRARARVLDSSDGVRSAAILSTPSPSATKS